MSTTVKGRMLGWGFAAFSAIALSGGIATAADKGDMPGTSSERSTTRTSSGTTTEELTTTTVTVEDIDKRNRKLMLKNNSGERMTVNVPPDIKEFDNIKKGDVIDIDYYRAVAVSLMPPGSAPSSVGQQQESGSGEGTKWRQTTVQAEIVSVNPQDKTVQVKGPGGKLQTYAVQNPEVQKRLPTIKPGQMVQLTVTEAAAAAIRPRKK